MEVINLVRRVLTDEAKKHISANAMLPPGVSFWNDSSRNLWRVLKWYAQSRARIESIVIVEDGLKGWLLGTTPSKTASQWCRSTETIFWFVACHLSTRSRERWWWISRLVMPMRREGRRMDGSESKRSKDSPVPWPTSAYDTYSGFPANQSSK